MIFTNKMKKDLMEFLFQGRKSAANIRRWLVNVYGEAAFYDGIVKR